MLLMITDHPPHCAIICKYITDSLILAEDPCITIQLQGGSLGNGQNQQGLIGNGIFHNASIQNININVILCICPLQPQRSRLSIECNSGCPVTTKCGPAGSSAADWNFIYGCQMQLHTNRILLVNVAELNALKLRNRFCMFFVIASLPTHCATFIKAVANNQILCYNPALSTQHKGRACGNLQIQRCLQFLCCLHNGFHFIIIGDKQAVSNAGILNRKSDGLTIDFQIITKGTGQIRPVLISRNDSLLSGGCHKEVEAALQLITNSSKCKRCSTQIVHINRMRLSLCDTIIVELDCTNVCQIGCGKLTQQNYAFGPTSFITCHQNCGCVALCQSSTSQ